MRSLIYILFNFLLISVASGQALVTSVPFSTASTYLEPDGRRESLKISDNEFVTLSKAKGGLAGPSEFIIEKFDKELKSAFKATITAGEEEDYKELYFNGEDIILFSVIHENMKKSSKLVAYGFDRATGTKKYDKVLDEFKVNEYMPVKFKGGVKETFENSVNSCITKHYVTPFNYQFEIKFSPDNNKVLTYIYDYSQKTLVASAKVFDKTLNPVASGLIPIDNNFINYGIYPNNKGEVFILNVDRLGRVVLVKFNLESKDNKLLDLQYTSTHRESLVLKLINDDVAFVGNICTKDGKMTGVMYAKFDFNTNLIEKINYHELSDGLKQTITLMRQSNKSLQAEETWKHYQITDFHVNEYGKVVIVVEKREINAPGFNFDLSETNEPEKWKEKAGRVNAEGMLLFSFNKDDELLWENVFLKSQMSDVSSGLISASYSMDISDEGKVRMIYAASNNATGILNSINYVEWDELTGTKVKEVPLQNDEGMTIMRGFTVWFQDKLIVAGRKGLLGKKSFISLYKL